MVTRPSESTRVIVDNQFRWRQDLPFYTTFISFVIGLFLFIIHFSIQNQQVFWIGFFLGYVVATLVADWRLDHYKCPTCGKRIGNPSEYEATDYGDTIRYFCEACDILWDTQEIRVRNTPD